ncbi:MAG: hypothetical protein M9921_06080 [Fimbriimonadaceae bacterium]|nr:hypothetical protein [Fimbriimonadaceae bacterium]
MRIKNKEIRQRRHRKEKRVKEILKDLRAKYEGKEKAAPAPAPEKPAAKKKAAPKPKAEAAEKVPAEKKPAAAKKPAAKKAPAKKKAAAPAEEEA